MRKYIIPLVLLVAFNINAQILAPIKVEFSSVKKGSQAYEVNIKVTIEKGWHIFSQYSEQEDGLGPLPTLISFQDNKALTFKDEVKEKGKLIEKYEDVFEVNTKYYEGSVTFVQTVQNKTDKPIKLRGTITYMACKDGQCLTPQEIKFEVFLN